jgi:hypothetical protein
MDNLFDLKNSLFRRGTGSELRSPTQWGPYGYREALVQRATSLRDRPVWGVGRLVEECRSKEAAQRAEERAGV